MTVKVDKNEAKEGNIGLRKNGKKRFEILARKAKFEVSLQSQVSLRL